MLVATNAQLIVENERVKARYSAGTITCELTRDVIHPLYLRLALLWNEDEFLEDDTMIDVLFSNEEFADLQLADLGDDLVAFLKATQDATQKFDGWRQEHQAFLAAYGLTDMDMDGINTLLKKWVYSLKLKPFCDAMRPRLRQIGVTFVSPSLVREFVDALYVAKQGQVDVEALRERVLNGCRWRTTCRGQDEAAIIKKYKRFFGAFFDEYREDQKMMQSLLKFWNSKRFEIPRECMVMIRCESTDIYLRNRKGTATPKSQQLPFAHGCMTQLDFWNTEEDGEEGEREFTRKLVLVIQNADGSYGQI